MPKTINSNLNNEDKICFRLDEKTQNPLTNKYINV